MLKPGYEVCRSCKSESLFSGFFDEDGFAVHGKSETDYPWKTFCNDCGHDQDFYASGRPVRAKKESAGRRHTKGWSGPTTGFSPSC